MNLQEFDFDCPDEHQELLEDALENLPKTEEGLQTLCGFLRSYPYYITAWTTLFFDFEDLMSKETRAAMLDLLKSHFDVYERRNSFYYLIPELEEEDLEFLKKFPETEEGFAALFKFLKKETNCIEGWRLLFSPAFEQYVTEDIRHFVVNLGDHDIIYVTLGEEAANSIF